MFEEGEAEVGVGPDAVEAVVGVDSSFFDGVGAEVGEFAGFEVGPYEFDGVEVVSVAGEPFDDFPGAVQRASRAGSRSRPASLWSGVMAGRPRST